MCILPQTLFLSLRKPAALLLSNEEIETDCHISINGVAVEGNDTPWVATVADLLVDETLRTFVGLTFWIDRKNNVEAVRSLCQELDSSVLRLNDIATPGDKQLYPGEAGFGHRVEIKWAKAESLSIEWAQILCGQWYWLYAKAKECNVSHAVIGVQINDVGEILEEHGLSFPSTILPQLNVEWYKST